MVFATAACAKEEPKKVESQITDAVTAFQRATAPKNNLYLPKTSASGSTNAQPAQLGKLGSGDGKSCEQGGICDTFKSNSPLSACPANVALKAAGLGDNDHMLPPMNLAMSAMQKLASRPTTPTAGSAKSNNPYLAYAESQITDAVTAPAPANDNCVKKDKNGKCPPLPNSPKPTPKKPAEKK